MINASQYRYEEQGDYASHDQGKRISEAVFRESLTPKQADPDKQATDQ
jgi:hypothetical protein